MAMSAYAVKKLTYLSMLFFCLTSSLCACGNSGMGENEDVIAMDYEKSGSDKVMQEKKADEAAVEIDEEPTAFERLFSEGLIPAQDKSGLWGYIDISGNYVIPPSFLGAKSFLNNEMAFAQDAESQLWGLIDKSGKYIVEPTFSKMGDSFCCDLLRVKVPGRGWGYMNQSGEMAIEPQFDTAYDFCQGFARVSTQVGIYTDYQTGTKYQYNKYGYINTSGERITEEIFTDAYDFSEGLALVSEDVVRGMGIRLSFGYYGYIDSSGEYVIHPYERWYEEATSFANGRAFGKSFIGTEEGEWYHFEMIDKEGNILLQTAGDAEGTLRKYCGDNVGNRTYFISDLRAVLSPDGTGYVYIDLDGNVVLPSVPGEYYGEAGQFKDGYALVQDAASSLYGYIDLEGNWVIPPQYAAAGEFYGGYAAALDAANDNSGLIDGWGLINKEGTWVIPPQYIAIRDCRNEMACVEQGPLLDADNRKTVVIDMAGNCTWELDYFASVSLAAPDRLMVTEWDENSESIVSFRYRDGKTAIDASFEQSNGFSSDYSYAKVKYEGLWGIIDKDGNWLIPAKFLAFE